ncbi:MAG: ATP-binding protein [Bacteroides sp.]|nr:ATP-binding protein [Bacteroides sp.]
MGKLNYPISTADFERIRKENFVYVDKTQYLYSLVSTSGFYFLSRPRRFGKSLLLSTLEAYFLGKKELFKGLEIYSLQPSEWTQYPVLHLDLSGKAYVGKDSLTSLLDMHLHAWEMEYGIDKPRQAVDERFNVVIETVAAKSGEKVVVLVDEYDSPLSDSIGNEELLEYFRTQLHGFYSVLKKTEKHIQFCMLTGVTKFGKVSVFSGLNNLRDISLNNKYAGICGITEDELHKYFMPGVEELADTEGWSIEDAFNQLKFYYDGYHFSKSLLDVYNPYSVINALAELEIANYWCASGIPTLLSKSLKNIDYNLEKLNGTMVSAEMLSNLSAYQTDPVALFYQTGYLTIKGYDRPTNLFILGYPNREVERGILGNILRLYVPNSDYTDVNVVVTFLRESLKRGEPEKFISQLKTFLSGIPSKLRTRISKYENYYHTIFYCIASLIGLDVNVEYNTSEGFIDMLIKTSGYIYIIELKINGNAESAIHQIEDKHYAEQFTTDHRKLYKIGIGFSKKTHNINSFIII